MQTSEPAWKKQYLKLLREVRACATDREHAMESTAANFSEFWNGVHRGDRLLWISAKLLDRKIVVMAACQCARTALKFVKPGEDRPRMAIETAERWCHGDASLEEIRRASAAAYDAAYDAATYAAYDAYSAYAAAHEKALKEMADIVRCRIPAEMIWAAVESKLGLSTSQRPSLLGAAGTDVPPTGESA